MSGTQPLTELTTQTVVRLTAGLSKTPLLKFAWGAPVEPVTVGVRGHWAVLADGLLDTHLYLGFDGHQLLIALGAPDAQVMLNGKPLLGRGWFQVPVPGHIQMAAGELRVEHEGQMPGLMHDLAASPNSSIETLFDGGQLRERGRVVVEPTPPPAYPSSPPAAFATREAPWAPRDAQGALGGPSSAVPSDQAKRARASSSPPSAVTSAPPPAASRGFWREASGPKKLIVVLMPFALASTFWVIWDDGDGTEVGAAPTPKASVAATAAAPSAAAASALAKTPSAPPSATAPEISAEPAVTAPPRLAKTPPAPPSATAQEVTAAGAASAVGSSAPTPSAVASTTPKPDAAVAGANKLLLDANGFSPRTAVNAAFLGDWSSATKQYAALSSANPDNEAFRLAARLTADHAVRRP